MAERVLEETNNIFTPFWDVLWVPDEQDSLDPSVVELCSQKQRQQQPSRGSLVAEENAEELRQYQQLQELQQLQQLQQLQDQRLKQAQLQTQQLQALALTKKHRLEGYMTVPAASSSLGKKLKLHDQINANDTAYLAQGRYRGTGMFEHVGEALHLSPTMDPTGFPTSPHVEHLANHEAPPQPPPMAAMNTTMPDMTTDIQNKSATDALNLFKSLFRNDKLVKMISEMGPDGQQLLELLNNDPSVGPATVQQQQQQQFQQQQQWPQANATGSSLLHSGHRIAQHQHPLSFTVQREREFQYTQSVQTLQRQRQLDLQRLQQQKAKRAPKGPGTSLDLDLDLDLELGQDFRLDLDLNSGNESEDILSDNDNDSTKEEGDGLSVDLLPYGYIVEPPSDDRPAVRRSSRARQAPASYRQSKRLRDQDFAPAPAKSARARSANRSNPAPHAAPSQTQINNDDDDEDDDDDDGKRRRRKKTTSQMEHLRNCFLLDSKPEKEQLTKIANDTDLTYQEVSRWFRNERHKFKKYKANLAKKGLQTIPEHSKEGLHEDVETRRARAWHAQVTHGRPSASKVAMMAEAAMANNSQRHKAQPPLQIQREREPVVQTSMFELERQRQHNFEQNQLDFEDEEGEEASGLDVDQPNDINNLTPSASWTYR